MNMKRKSEAREGQCLLVAESGAPWAECASWLSTRARDVATVIQLPNELPPAFQTRLQEKLRLLEDVHTVVFVASSASGKLHLRSSLLRGLVGSLPGVARIVLCPGSDPDAPAAHELAGLSLTMRELGGGSITCSLQGPHGEPLRGLAYLAAA